MNSLKRFLENLVMVVIALVIVFTFIEDLSAYLMWDWNTRKVLLYLGFAFDLFFTIEFLFRYIASIVRGDTAEYMIHRRGWVDFVASIPLLMFNSGPSVYFLLTGAAFAGGAGVLNILKVIKAVRVARILRMLRVLKIFRTIKSIDSKMTQRHLTRIISTVVVSVIAVMFVGSLIFSENLISSPAQSVQNGTHRRIAQELDKNDGDMGAVLPIAKSLETILIVKHDGETLVSRYSDSYYNENFGPGDFEYIREGSIELFLDMRYSNAASALPGMLLLLTIIFTVLVLMFIYSPHFAMTISDPVFVMLKGMKEKNYNLEVDIPHRYKEDDIFKLSSEYNDKYLTLKAREDSADEEGESVLKMEDLGDLTDLLS